MTELPTGTVTFVFTDIEGSTNLARTLAQRWPGVLEEHHTILRDAIRSNGGVEVGTEGDAFFAVFTSAVDAVAGCAQAQRELAAHPWPEDGTIRVRMGMHTGEGRLGGGEYVGLDVHRAARIAAAGHGGQVLLSEATRALVADHLPQGLSLADLGARRLKDFDQPQHIYQLEIEGLPSQFPALRTLDVPTNLPPELTSFIGRERELEQVGRLLKEARVVTLTGPGGSGKTRLAARVAAGALDRFPDGVFFVDLASTEDPELVPAVIAAALGIREEGPRPLVDTVQSELRDRTALLVLDNFEQLLEAAPVMAVLLSAAPRVRFLVTSRGSLGIQGEHEFPVSPLALPDPAAVREPSELRRFEAVALFVERAAAIDPAFDLDDENAIAVAEICRRLDGLPLAIELAASRTRLLPPRALLERLDRALPLLAARAPDLPTRQRTLRGAIAWSYDLLSPAVRPLFRRACVFAGGFTVEAAQSVCDPEGELDVGVLDGLQAVLDASLVRRRPDGPGDVRFDTLQTIREFGLERLDQEEHDPSEIRRRHARYFLDLAEEAAPELRAPKADHYLDVVEAEHDNLRAALRWAIDADEGETGLRLVAALWRFWHLRGHLTGGRRWGEEVLALPSARSHTLSRAKALEGVGSLAYWQTDPPATREAYEEALAIANELGDQAAIAEALYYASGWHPFEGDFATSAAMLQEALAMFEGLGNERGVGDALFLLSVIEGLEGNLDVARRDAEEALRIHRKLGDEFGSTGSEYSLGRSTFEMGDMDEARTHFLATLESAEHMGDRTGMALVLDNLALQANVEGRHERAMRLAGASQAIKDGIGGEAPPALLHLPDPRDIARQHLSDDEIQAALEEGGSMTLEQALAYARGEEE